MYLVIKEIFQDGIYFMNRQIIIIDEKIKITFLQYKKSALYY